ncbi:MAG: hypothetical protein J6U00_02650 [Ruminococcus sp.]|uniref:hypothetical protein n=1 Tax=Ruminococcus sp. TaxID=41978 RepID=UPI001B12705B|nr:hypothetical protein [Ruminococcus sp.]MBO7472897.1 hypothetical protein [Ruminococcus sp.]
MPHSSGGGSHGGGSHGGSSGGRSSGSSIGRSLSTISSRRFPGSRRYATYRNGEPRYFYASKDYELKYNKKRLLLGIMYLPFLLFIFLGFKKAMPIVPKNYNHNIVIRDDADVIENEWELRDSLEKFMDKTGITPSVVTLYTDDWLEEYTTLEKYAYQRYIDEFNDEMHWLIVYSKSKVYTSSGSGDWIWEGMQGNDTDPILKKRELKKFNSKLEELLERNDTDVGTAISSAFDDFTDKISFMPDLLVLIMPLFMLIFVLFHAYFMLGLNELKYRNAVPAPEKGIDDISSEPYGGTAEIGEYPESLSTIMEEQICPYCGGKYKSTVTGRCPHCNASTSSENKTENVDTTTSV